MDDLSKKDQLSFLPGDDDAPEKPCAQKNDETSRDAKDDVAAPVTVNISERLSRVNVSDLDPGSGPGGESDDESSEDAANQHEFGDSPGTPNSQRALRDLAFTLVYAYDRRGGDVPLEKLAEHFRGGFNVDFEDDCFAMRLAAGALERRDEFEVLLKPLLQHWKLERLSCSTRVILWIALWELMYTDTPKTVVINEAVELSKTFAEADAYRFINGILDEYCTQNEK
jgi:transcription antitermination protein NusB